MKKTIYYSLIIVAIILFNRCGNDSENIKNYRLAILVSDKLGNNPSDKLPESIIDLCLPFEIDNCSDYFIAEPILSRISDKNIELLLETKIEGFAVNKSNKNVIKREINKHLQETQMGSDLCNPNKDSVDFLSAIKKYIETHKTSNILCFSYNNLDSLFLGYKNFSDIESIRKELGQILCKLPTSSIIIIYNPPSIVKKEIPEQLQIEKRPIKVLQIIEEKTKPVIIMKTSKIAEYEKQLNEAKSQIEECLKTINRLSTQNKQLKEDLLKVCHDLEDRTLKIQGLIDNLKDNPANSDKDVLNTQITTALNDMSLQIKEKILKPGYIIPFDADSVKAAYEKKLDEDKKAFEKGWIEKSNEEKAKTLRTYSQNNVLIARTTKDGWFKLNNTKIALLKLAVQYYTEATGFGINSSNEIDALKKEFPKHLK